MVDDVCGVVGRQLEVHFEVDKLQDRQTDKTDR